MEKTTVNSVRIANKDINIMLSLIGDNVEIAVKKPNAKKVDKISVSLADWGKIIEALFNIQPADSID